MPPRMCSKCFPAVWSGRQDLCYNLACMHLFYHVLLMSRRKKYQYPITVLAMCVSTGSHPGIQESRCLMPSLCELKVAASIAVHPPKSHAQHGNQYLHCWKSPWTILSLSLCQFDMGILEQILLYFFVAFFFRWGHFVFYPQAWKTIPNSVDTRSFEVLCFDHVPGRMVEMSSCLQGLNTLSVTVQMFETPFSMVMVEVSNVPSPGESIVTFSHWLTPGNECLCGFPIWKGPAAFSVQFLPVIGCSMFVSTL